MSQPNRQNQKTRFFLLAFALSFFLLAIMGLIVVFLLNPAPEESSSFEQTSADTFYLPREEDNISVLLSGYAEKEEGAVFFALARLDMLSGGIPVVLFPPQTILDEQTGYATLAQAYAQGGAPAAAKAIAETYSIPVDRYADIDSQSLIDAVNRVGVAEYTLTQDLSYHADDIFISLSAGRQLIDGQKFWDILRYPDYDGGVVQQCQEGAQLIAAYLNGRLSTVLGDNAQALVSGLLDLVDTNLSYVDYESRQPALQFLSKLEGDPAQAYPLTGAWNKAGAFVPDAAARRQLVQRFG